MGLTTQELGDQLKAGKILAKDMVPKLAQSLRELAAPGLAASLQRLDAYFGRLGNSWDRFQKIIYDSGLETFLKTIATAFKQILDGGSPIGAMLGGIFKGLSDIAYAIQLPIALFLDWAESVGWIDKETGKFIDSVNTGFEWIGRTISLVFGVLALKLIGGFMLKLSSILPLLSTIGSGIGTIFSGAGIARILAAMASALSGSSTVLAAFGALGTALAWAVTGAFVAAIGVGIGSVLSEHNFLWTKDIGNWLGGTIYDLSHGKFSDSKNNVAKLPNVNTAVSNMVQNSNMAPFYLQQPSQEKQPISIMIQEKPGGGFTQFIQATAVDAVNTELGANMTGN